MEHYKLLSGIGTHASYLGFELLRPTERGDACRGPFFAERSLRPATEELAKACILAAEAFPFHFKPMLLLDFEVCSVYGSKGGLVRAVRWTVGQNWTRKNARRSCPLAKSVRAGPAATRTDTVQNVNAVGHCARLIFLRQKRGPNKTAPIYERSHAARGVFKLSYPDMCKRLALMHIRLGQGDSVG